jgi:hypothetical protein
MGVTDIVELDADADADAALRDVLSGLRRPVAQLQAVITRLAGTLEQRAIDAAPPGRRSAATQTEVTEP